MDLSSQKKFVVAGIIGCLLFLFLVRDDRPAHEPESEAVDTAGQISSPSSEPPSSESNAEPPPPSPPAAHEPEATVTPATTSEAREPSNDREDPETTPSPDERASEDDPTPRTIWPPDAEGIQGAVRDSNRDLRECYDAWLRLHPEVAGAVKISFAVETADPNDPEAPTAEDGTPLAAVVDMRIVSDLEHTLMEGCVGNVFGDLWFSPPEDGRMEVTYPLVFSSED